MSGEVAFEHRKVLQLNKSWAAMHPISLAKALHMVFKERARIVDSSDFQALTWSDWAKLEPVGGDAIRGVNDRFRVPEVIVLNGYDKLPGPRKTFSRRTLYKRDHHTCSYCGRQPGTSELTLDHVLPRSQGGKTTWENVVLACTECNFRKAARTPEQAGMKLRVNPGPPTYKTMKHADYARVDSWQSFLGEMYWEVELSE